MGTTNPGRFLFDSPAIYQICVQGAITTDWSDRLQGMTIRVVTSEDAPPMTVLVGELLDQSSLVGVLNTLFDLHLTLLMVRCNSELLDVLGREFDLCPEG